MVNPAITATLIAAASRQQAEEKIESRLKKAKAVSRASAVALELDEKEQRLLEEAIAEGTVRRAEDGRVYLVQQRIADRKEGQIFMALLSLLVIASLIASVAILASRVGG